MHTIQVGDKVRLTGKSWDTDYGDEVSVGDIVEVDEVDIGGVWAGDAGAVGNRNGLYSAINPEPSGDYSVELVSGNSEEATRNRAKSFTETVSDFSPAVSHEDIESISRLGDALGISSFEQNVRRITGQIADLLIAKNKQYSNSALDPIRVFSKANRTEQLKVRADDKLSRIRNGDTSEDAILDLCGYLILMKIAGESE